MMLNMSTRSLPVAGHRLRTAVTVAGMSRARKSGPGLGSDSPLLLGRKGPSTSPPGKLIMPGGERPQQRIVLPDNIAPVDGAGSPLQLNKFRPPQGFMDDIAHLQVDTHTNVPAQQLLERLSSTQGSWPSRAKMVLSLLSKGVDFGTIFQATGVAGAEQSALVIASTILDSLRASDTIPKGLLDQMEKSNGWARLFPLRFLETQPRSAAAMYIVQNAVGEEDCEVLARSMKEWERRPLERYGFTEQPGDCLAFKFYRDAIETRNEEECLQRVQQGLAVAVTAPARKRLEELVIERAKEEKDDGLGVITIARLSQDELAYRPLALLKELGEASVSDLAAAPRTSQEGAFGSFMLEGAAISHRWVALPMWRALAMAKHPVAISIANCSKVPGIVTGTRCKTDDDRRRLNGAGLLVVDVSATPEPKDVDDAGFYLILTEPTRQALVLASGSRARSAATILATVLFVVRPPHNEYIGSSGPEMLQV